jgi:hypothetical protein
MVVGLSAEFRTEHPLPSEYESREFPFACSVCYTEVTVNASLLELSEIMSSFHKLLVQYIQMAM